MEVKNIPISAIHPSPMNPRKTFDESELQELADNIEKQGLLQPITVRPAECEPSTYDEEAHVYVKGEPISYEIICGERRYRATKMIHDKGLLPHGTIAAIVREMDDDQALLAMLTENLQRKDVDPMEEAYSIGELLKRGKSVEEVAAILGKSPRFVSERSKLNSLIPDLMLAVKEGRMPIVAAQIICKLTEDEQSAYYKTNCNNSYGLSKAGAKSYVNNLFMELDKSLWYESDNQADEDFAEGCERKCSECPLNTANHGCLFYEMKADGAGRCTDRSLFNAKTEAFMLHTLEEFADILIKPGEAMERGKAVVGITIEDYEPDESKKNKQRIKELLVARGYEVVNPKKVFKSKCYYEKDDDRHLKKLKNGETFRVISLFNYMRPSIEEQAWYFKSKEEVAACTSGAPARVNELLNDLKCHDGTENSSKVVAGVKALHEAENYVKPLTEVERNLLMVFLINDALELRQEFGLAQSGPTDKDWEYVKAHPDMMNAVLRGWMIKHLHAGSNEVMSLAAPVLDELGALWCPDKYKKALDNEAKKRKKKRAKIINELASLGYGPDGNPLSKDEIPKNTTPRDMVKAHADMKAKHPKAIVLCRVNDFYETFGEDAETVADILKITLTRRKHGKESIALAGFPHHALDTYLPQLIRAGKKVAICEQLDKK